MQRTDSNAVTEVITTGFGDFTERKYTKGKLLGKGGFAKCYELINEATKIVLAAKIIPKASLVKTRQRQKVS